MLLMLLFLMFLMLLFLMLMLSSRTVTIGGVTVVCHSGLVGVAFLELPDLFCISRNELRGDAISHQFDVRDERTPSPSCGCWCWWCWCCWWWCWCWCWCCWWWCCCCCCCGSAATIRPCIVILWCWEIKPALVVCIVALVSSEIFSIVWAPSFLTRFAVSIAIPSASVWSFWRSRCSASAFSSHAVLRFRFPLEVFPPREASFFSLSRSAWEALATACS
mmetsp:Transcript_30338/g.71537  ORF Transcript_30338/g.71537 Transcript_30338/m.71537 type:complete len:219 (+) Transcript_30338:1-657(+)